MIKKVFYDGAPKDRDTEIKVNRYLRKLENDRGVYVVGIDYAKLNSKDHTTITHTTEDDNGVVTVEGIELL